MCGPDVIGVFTMLLNVLALRSRARQAEILKRTVTISDASSASMDIALWGERATTFPAEQVHKDGQTTLQVMIFVGTLVKCYTTTQILSSSMQQPGANNYVRQGKAPLTMATEHAVKDTWSPMWKVTILVCTSCSQIFMC